WPRGRSPPPEPPPGPRPGRGFVSRSVPPLRVDGYGTFSSVCHISNKMSSKMGGFPEKAPLIKQKETLWNTGFWRKEGKGPPFPAGDPFLGRPSKGCLGALVDLQILPE